jgi:DhnA family fructose-bisphosphate aldolase class Ia
MTGAELRMQRLFGKESGRAYVVAIDHGMLFGVLEGSEDAITAVERSLNTDPDGLSRRMLDAGLAGGRLRRLGWVRISSYFRTL